MKPAIFTAFGVMGYVVLNVIIDRKLANASPLATSTMMFGLGLCVLVPATLIQARFDPNFTLPRVNSILLVLVIAVFVALADYLYLRAYHEAYQVGGGSLMTICTMVALFPFFASILNAAIGGGLPNQRHLLGWLFAVIAVILISKPDPRPQPSSPPVSQGENHERAQNMANGS